MESAPSPIQAKGHLPSSQILQVGLSPPILDPGSNASLEIGGGQTGVCLSFTESILFRCV